MPSGIKRTTFYYAQAFQLGEEEAYDYFFRLYFKALCFFARTLIQDDCDAEDIVQDCFTRLWQKHTLIKNPESIKSFLYHTVRNACLDYQRRKKVRDKHLNLVRLDEVNLEKSLIEYEDGIIRTELIREIYNLVSNLPAPVREVFYLYYAQGKTEIEIADFLNCSFFTARNRRLRALSFLRHQLNP